MGRILHAGTRGADVARVQRQLNCYVIPRLPVNGVYGPKTETAVRGFQRAVGFTGRDVDGVVGPKTLTALFQIFDMKIRGKLEPNANRQSNQPPTNPQGGRPNPLPRPEPLPGNADAPDLPKRFQGAAKIGVQGSPRDGLGAAVELDFTLLTRNYFPNSPKNKFYHNTHGEYQLSWNLGLPPEVRGIYTGQLSIAVQPVTDWLVLGKRLHLLNPSIGIFGQIPLNSKDYSNPDPALHPRVGLNLGLELFHVDVVKGGGVLFGVQSQAAGYLDFTDRRMVWDPQIFVFLGGTFDFGPQIKPLPHNAH